MKLKIANVLFGGTDALDNNPLLMLSASRGGKWSFDPELGANFSSGCYDFLSYFNGLSVSKWNKYSIASHYGLHLEFKGSARCTLVEAGPYDWFSRELTDQSQVLSSVGSWNAVDIDFQTSDDCVLASFALKVDSSFEIKNAYFYAEVSCDALNDVELSLAMTTFKKESYAIANIESIRRSIFDGDEDLANHLTLHIVDNGRTLPIDRLESARVHIHPNPNVGGSGGFARGMIESLRQSPKSTHVLLMDDDVEVLPESFIRTYALLRLVKDEYRDAFLSGAMFSLEQPDLRTEDLGFFTFNGNFSPLKPEGHMTFLHDVVQSELYEPPVDLYDDTAQVYAGWWYCVIPVTQIEKNGLPLPLFVRSDDAEYALRCKPKFMTMNGICVWHNAFFYKYSAAVERYQVSRNTLISQATTGIAPMTDFVKEIYHEVQLDLKKFNYDDALLAVEGFEDFLRGPEYISSPVAESRFMDANRNKEKLVPIEDLAPEAEKYGVDIYSLDHATLNLGGLRSKAQAAFDYLTFNGQRLIKKNASSGDKVAVIDAAGWVYPSGKLHDVDTIIAVDMPNKKGVIRHRDIARFNEVWKRFKKAESYYKKNKDRLYAEYAAAKDKLISVEFWEQYLAEASDK